MSIVRDVPLVVDLDGTLTPSDTLVESLVHLVKHTPAALLKLPFWLFGGRAEFKRSVARQADFAPETLPYRESLVAYLRAEKEKGREIILATAAHRSIADRVAAQLGLFDRVLATDDLGSNLKGKNKLELIREQVGETFVYAGDCAADLPVWEGATGAVLVGVPEPLASNVRGKVPIEKEFPRDSRGWSVWLRALRIHQWMKNLLLFVPLLTAFSFSDASALAHLALGFWAFSLAASATYIVNDLWDLDNDRAHPRKRTRPFASGQLPILHGIAISGGLLGCALIMAFLVSPKFLLMLLLYLVMTSAYSWVLKQYVLIDVLMLSLLYTLRIVAGAVAIGVTTSSWLLAFSVFIFLSLALVKRCSELVVLEAAGNLATRGRDYRVKDLVVLWPLGVCSALAAVVVFGLFIDAPDTRSRYATPEILWLVAFCLIYWIARLWIKTSRGEMHDDPVVYALKNRGSRQTVVAMVVLMLLAHFVHLGNLL